MPLKDFPKPTVPTEKTLSEPVKGQKLTHTLRGCTKGQTEAGKHLVLAITVLHLSAL